jgi:chromosome partitioning protein
MRTIALAAAKGGVGRTTLSAALAVAAWLSTPSLRVALIDLDPQGSLTLWWNTRALPQPILVELAGRSLAAVRRGLRAAGIDILILDCPPGFSSVLREAIGVSDLVLVPTGAGVLDLAAVAQTAEMAGQARKPFRFVLNRAVFRSRLAGRAVVVLRDRGGLLPRVHQRVLVAEAMAAGRTAQETGPGSKAAGELSDLWLAVWACLLDLVARRPARRVGAGGRI